MKHHDTSQLYHCRAPTVRSLIAPYGRGAGIPPSEDGLMLHALYYPRDLITERVRFTPADHTQIAHCRGVHNRLGFAASC